MRRPGRCCGKRADTRMPQLMLGTLVLAGATRAARIVRRRKSQRWGLPSGSVTHGSLTARRLGSAGPPILLIHGMAGSNLYWGRDFDALGRRGRVIAVDVLGFGESPKPLTGYGPREHADALASCLRELGMDGRAVVVGHSMGAVIALALAREHPELVDRVVAFAPPIYSSRSEGMRHVRAMGILEGLMAFGPASHLLCRWMCDHREHARRVAPVIQPGLPPAIARDTVRHTWHSYSQSMEQLILSSEAPNWVRTINRPVRIIVALDDPVPDLTLLSRLREENDLISLDIWSHGGHHLPLTQPAKCLAAILGADGCHLPPRVSKVAGIRQRQSATPAVATTMSLRGGRRP